MNRVRPSRAGRHELPDLPEPLRVELLALSDARRDVMRRLRDSDHAAPALDLFMGDADELRARVQAVHRYWWPRHRGRLVVTEVSAHLVSSTGRSVRPVWVRGL